MSAKKKQSSIYMDEDYIKNLRNMISYTHTPEWANTVKKSLEMRNFGKLGNRWPHTGGNWSAAWRMAIWARLHDGNTAIRIFNQLIKESGYP